MLSIINNMAIGYQAINEIEKSQMMFQHLLSTIMYIVDVTTSNSNPTRGGGSFLSSVYDGFLQNVSSLVSTNIVAPAA